MVATFNLLYSTITHCTVPEIGFTMSSDSVSESELSYTITIRSTVAGAASDGLVQVVIPQGATATGETKGLSTPW